MFSDRYGIEKQMTSYCQNIIFTLKIVVLLSYSFELLKINKLVRKFVPLPGTVNYFN